LINFGSMNEKAEILNDIIRNRRSVFPAQFSGEIIDEAIILQLLENANWAPTHRLTQPWRFTVFSGDGLKKLADFQSDFYLKNTPAEKFEQAKYEKMQKNPLLCSHVISIGVSLQNKESVPDIEEQEAVACAVQNILLTAHSYGLGAYWGSGGVTYKKEVNPFFNLEKEDLLLGFVLLGVPKEVPQTGKRTPIDTKVHWVK
jgi:nitroreductase